LILNPFDERSVGWTPFADAEDMSDFEKLAHSIFKDPRSGDPYWTKAARQIFQWAAFNLRQEKMKRGETATLPDLLKVMFGPLKDLERLLVGTPAHNHIASGEGPRVSSLTSVLVEGVTPLIYLSAKTGDFSLRCLGQQSQGSSGVAVHCSARAPDRGSASLAGVLG